MQFASSFQGTRKLCIRSRETMQLFLNCLLDCQLISCIKVAVRLPRAEGLCGCKCQPLLTRDGAGLPRLTWLILGQFLLHAPTNAYKGRST